MERTQLARWSLEDLLVGTFCYGGRRAASMLLLTLRMSNASSTRRLPMVQPKCDPVHRLSRLLNNRRSEGGRSCVFSQRAGNSLEKVPQIKRIEKVSPQYNANDRTYMIDYR